MAPPAKSRKGKKAWRKNIDSTEVEEFLTEQTYQQRRGPAAAELKDDQLFFVDTSADVEGATAVAEGKRPAKRRREEAAAKPLKAELIIGQAHKAKPVALAPPQRKPTPAAAAAVAELVAASAAAPTSGKKAAAAQVKTSRAIAAAAALAKAGGAKRHPLDLWAEGDDDDDGAAAAPGPSSRALALALAQQQQQQQNGGVAKKSGQTRRGAKGGASGSSGSVPLTTVRKAMGPSAPGLRRRSRSPPPVLPVAARQVLGAKAVTAPRAVAPDLPGCSFNPDHEQHQDALAVLVAAELRKELARELMPDAPPPEVEAEVGGRPLTELERLQVEVDEEEDEDEEEEGAGAGKATGEGQQADPNAIALDVEEEEEEEEEGDDAEEGGSGSGDEEGPRSKKQKQEKKTKKDRNKEARRKALDAQLAERKRLKAQRRELHSLRGVEAELAATEEERELKRQRLAALRAEKAAVEPPRLGKLRFEAPAVAVLTSDQKTGSLRQVVPCSMLAADRFKSLQQRGLVEPRKPQPFKERRRKVQYEKGGRFEKAEALSTEVREMGRVNKKARRAAAKTAAAGGGDDDWL
ncbi:hypothetical protein HYH02_011398 [Chlamydomonas schloesseri]|uniref:Ribosome biogenesis protein NOP53 n=1 Tax=Chlamydomonas schloesseri TaxID=2026947 RepID=A0A835W1I9_9CHLO|nr:hypothetical protein HYH02_011398 [Chlamydomonas schloesseri]|eukprot:KAG2437142.1 hypothetical protein HYH02_011398 [Chlamydomonas schloesseri]